MKCELIEEIREVFERHGFSVTSTDIVKPAIEWYIPCGKYVDFVERCTDITSHLIERKETTK